MTTLNPLQWSSVALTHHGKTRKLNEDSYLELAERNLWAIADGMGGHAAGDIASRMVIDSLRNTETPSSLESYIDDVYNRLQKVNKEVRDEATKRGEGIIGSTVVVLLAFGHHYATLWAGDSRIYLSRGGILKQITRDHSQVEELIAHGLLERSEAANHPAHNAITRAVGAADKLVLDVNIQNINDGDIFLLCSDGLTNEVNDREIAQELVRGNCHQSCSHLMQKALDRGARDNVTIIVTRVDDPLQATKINIRSIPLNDKSSK